ncbi:progestin and adipoQ receptor family member 4-like [Ptychodera flava]|uniref:progestin and adipoQ receptor family member 4-like n=1 Tax=Ptychodera flava TaxID=63121 RepID=UPI003969FFD1
MLQPERLLSWASSPPHLQFNRFILSGYRPTMSAKDCMYSLFYVHNEFLNIHSHGLPLLYFVFCAPAQVPWQSISDSVTWLVILHYLATISVLLGSVIYHLFMNHHGGPVVYKKLLQFDMCGIWTLNTFGVLSNVSAAFSNMSVLCWLVPGLYTLVSFCALHEAMTAETVRTRVTSFLKPSLFRWVVTCLRIAGSAGGSPQAVRHIVWMEIFSISGGFFNVTRIPERWFPGRFDYLFNSHQILHTLAILGILHLHWGTIEDIMWLSRTSL